MPRLGRVGRLAHRLTLGESDRRNGRPAVRVESHRDLFFARRKDKYQSEQNYKCRKDFFLHSELSFGYRIYYSIHIFSILLYYELYRLSIHKSNLFVFCIKWCKIWTV